MDKKKKNGATTGSNEGKERKNSSNSPSSKSKPVSIAISSVANNGDKPTKVRAASSTAAVPDGDKDARNSSSNDDEKTQVHARDEATNGNGKSGPQKKRRKVTHGTALHFHTHPHTHPLPFATHGQERKKVGKKLWCPSGPVRDNLQLACDVCLSFAR